MGRSWAFYDRWHRTRVSPRILATPWTVKICERTTKPEESATAIDHQTACFHTGSPSRRQGPATASPAGGGAGQQVQAGVESEKDARECGIPELEHEWCGFGVPRPWPAPTLGTTGVSTCCPATHVSCSTPRPGALDPCMHPRYPTWPFG